MIIPSINTLGFPDWTLTQVIEFASANHIPYIEIRALENTVDLLGLADFSDAQAVARARQRLDDAGVRVLALNLGLHLLDDLQPQAAAIRSYAALAQGLGAPYLRFFSGGDARTPLDMKALAAGARTVLDLLDGTPVRMIVETHDGLVRSADILALNAMLDDRLNLLWDIAHPINYGGERWTDTYRQVSALVRYLHVKDSRKAAGKVVNCLLFEGELPVREILEAMEALPREVIVSFEWEKMWQPDLPPGELAARDFLAKLRAIQQPR